MPESGYLLDQAGDRVLCDLPLHARNLGCRPKVQCLAAPVGATLSSAPERAMVSRGGKPMFKICVRALALAALGLAVAAPRPSLAAESMSQVSSGAHEISSNNWSHAYV